MDSSKEQRSIVFIVAVIAIVGSAFASGMTVYYWQKTKLNQKINQSTAPAANQFTNRESQTTSSNTSSNPATISAKTTPNSLTQNNSTTTNLSSAQLVLESFFKYLAEGNFDKAAENYYYDESEGALNTFYDYMDNDKMANTLSNFCQAQTTCLQVKVINQEAIENGYLFKVQFIKSDGDTYHYEVGGTISEDTFDYKVKLFTGGYRVVTPPLFHP